MRFTLILCGLALFCDSFAQEETAFRIITFSEGVRIGNLPVTQGMNVPSSKEQLVVPENGFVGVLTSDGLSYKLTQSTRISEVGRTVRLELGERKITVTSGTNDPAGIGFPLAPEYGQAGMTRDSLFIFWGWRQGKNYILLNRKSKGYTFQVTDMFGDPFKEITTDKNWVVVDLSPYREKEPAIIYSLKGDYDWGKLQEGLVRFGPKVVSEKAQNIVRDELKFYLNDIDKDFYEFMIYDLNGLRHDVSMTLFRIVRDKRKPTDPLIQKYLEWLTRKYSLDIIQLD